MPERRSTSIPQLVEELEALREQLSQLALENQELRRLVERRHGSASCSEQPSSSARRPLTCWWCRQPGHREADCRAKHHSSKRTPRRQETSHDSRRQRQPTERVPRPAVPNTRSPPKQRVCWYCRRVGHIQSECRTKQRRRRRGSLDLHPLQQPTSTLSQPCRQDVTPVEQPPPRTVTRAQTVPRPPATAYPGNGRQGALAVKSKALQLLQHRLRCNPVSDESESDTDSVVVHAKCRPVPAWRRFRPMAAAERLVRDGLCV